MKVAFCVALAQFVRYSFCMSNNNTENAIASDLNKISLMQAIGTKSAKRKASAHRKACFNEIKRMNISDGFSEMSDDEILSALFA